MDVSTDDGAQIAQKVMVRAQLAVEAFEGRINKFLVDDKGVAFEYEIGGTLENDPRSNVMIHSVISVLSRFGDSQQDA